jgi:2-keto-4-pentenoate hydratase/2-oxohepta-3-ene-1,7-dioic acid hydratase in catechol pathway
VGGYTCAQDVSARDVQFWTSQWTLGKTPDTFCPLGPALVTADEIPDPQTLRLQTLLNGQIMQDSNTSDMVFRVADIIECLSSLITLEVGDTVLTGTPQGVGAARKPPIFLRPGDVLETRIYKLGSMRNPVVAASHLSDAPSGLTGSAELRVDGSR